MEIPEKIYLSVDRYCDGYISIDYMWHRHQLDNIENIEYIRTDAFIEKACDYINRYLALLDTENNDCMPEWLEKFKEAMKGE